MKILVHQASGDDLKTVADVLGEAAGWLEEAGIPLWPREEIAAARIAADVVGGQFFLAESDGEIAGTIKFQLEDPEIWPDVPAAESAFIHRLAVRRRYAGQGISTALLQWAVEQTAAVGRQWLRMDCVAGRPRLRAIYERFGFQFHSERQVGRFLVARYQFDVRATASLRSPPARSFPAG